VRVALGVPRVHRDLPHNLRAIGWMTEEAAGRGARLVLFSEAALTGFGALSGDPVHDLPLGVPIPGEETARLAEVAVERRVWLALGFFEREGDALYDSAALFSPDGEIALAYRRIDPHWYSPHANPAVYRQGNAMPQASTELGTCAFLLCGDLFDDWIVQRVRATRPDLLLFPIARGLDEDVPDAASWYARERHLYARRARQAGTGMVLVNQLSGGAREAACFGGAMVVSGRGEIVAELPLGREGILIAEV
jgi:predicted amidohydrolase